MLRYPFGSLKLSRRTSRCRRHVSSSRLHSPTTSMSKGRPSLPWTLCLVRGIARGLVQPPASSFTHQDLEPYLEGDNFPVEKQNCHLKPCEMEMKVCPKKAKQYSYSKDCKNGPGGSVNSARRGPSSQCMTCRSTW